VDVKPPEPSNVAIKEPAPPKEVSKPAVALPPPPVKTVAAAPILPPIPPLTADAIPTPTPRDRNAVGGVTPTPTSPGAAASGAAAAPRVVAKPAAPPAPKPVAQPRLLPPIPERFEDALAAGKKALEQSLVLQEKFKTGMTPEQRSKIQELQDLAEEMLRGAWNMDQNNPEVNEALQKLVEQVHVIALVKSSHLISKPRGLVVLNAEPTLIFPKEKGSYYAWEQQLDTDSIELPLRREDLAKKTVALRIKDPGIYKFELVVSDGSRGGNPVTVTVEIRD
jgi:hypothetical protein